MTEVNTGKPTVTKLTVHKGGSIFVLQNETGKKPLLKRLEVKSLLQGADLVEVIISGVKEEAQVQQFLRIRPNMVVHKLSQNVFKIKVNEIGMSENAVDIIQTMLASSY